MSTEESEVSKPNDCDVGDQPLVHTVGQVVNQLNVYRQRAIDAEMVISAINNLHDGALDEVKAERDRCAKALQDIKRDCGAKSINAGTSTLGAFIDQILSGCPNVR